MMPYTAAYRGSCLLHNSGVMPAVITDSCSSAAISHCLLICFSQYVTQDTVSSKIPLPLTFIAFFSFIHSGTRSSIKHHHLPAAPVSVNLSDTLILYVSLQPKC